MTDNVKKFCNELGIVTSWPTRRHLQQEMLAYLSKKFQFNRLYSEKEINDILDRSTTLHDCCTLRRDLIDNLLLKRSRDCSKYWKIHKDLDYRMETGRLVIDATEASDIARLNEINRSVSYIGSGTITEPTDEYVPHCLAVGDIPHGGYREFYRFRKIVSRDTSQIVGFVEFYLGYPDIHTLWIGTLYIDKEHQHQGYGTEVIGKMISVAGKYGLEEAGAGVNLKNLPALSFWYKNGFSTNTGISADEDISPDSDAIVALKKHLA